VRTIAASLERYAVARLLIVLGVLAWSTVLLVSGEWSEAQATPFVGTCGVALLVVTLSRVWASRDRRVGSAFVYGQVTFDIVLASALSWLTGGHASFFVFTYFIAIAAAAYLLQYRGAIVTAALCTVGYLTMTLLQDTPTERLVIVYSEGMFRILAFFLVALLMGRLAEQAEATGAALERQQRSTVALAAAHDTVLAHVHAGVLTADGRRVVNAANPFAVELLGEVVGTSMDALFPGRTEADARSWEESRRDGQRWMVSENRLPDGGFVVLVHDVTELTRMKDRASRDERLIAAGRLAASMAHEIRNPLASLSGALQLVREDRPSRMLDLAVSESERLNRLVENFLGLAAQPRLRPVRADVSMIAHDVCDAFARDPRFVGRARATCVASRAFAEVDADRLRQAVWNLVLNGAQAMPAGGTITVLVAPGTHDGAEGVEVRVGDEGVGIADVDAERVFDPFYTTRSGGTGLGLAVVEQVVRAHGGVVSLRARVGGGAEFVIWLPATQAVSAPAPRADREVARAR
jgi:two-component system sensor histidine kinase PilS (NtrC family)